MSKNLKISLALALVVLAVVGTLLAVKGTKDDKPESATAQSEMLMRADSHKLSSAPDGKVTVVEFLDLECEACGAAFPVVERLRKEYEGRVTFVMRYFPIPSHRNAELAAKAVEAAGAQGKLEPMYTKMYETQKEWGDQQVSHEETFRAFARELGLDMPKFEQDWKSPATAERVDRDRRDGLALGVQGTPTFFLNGERLKVGSYEQFKAALDNALAAP
ncbi:DsbA family protein [Yinghuangia soli]|uniref:DsbA family protein n=1 Tax=Yinghuangia soli TaxID=2908204 RepID=A0AA41U8W2_9ACTN|nr:thioredoxin domain-containing protein [Yinghuangia soli]MCF2533294.1 DsbA family protein [Yinghuangia soli]